MEYNEFLNTKRIEHQPTGFTVDKLNTHLYDFQRDIVKWALKKGKACIFADCGMGKTIMQLEWAHQICKHIGGMVLILAPLAVSAQTKAEGEKFDIGVNICKHEDDLVDGINITNYERLHHFENIKFSGVILDESSILKSFTGKTRDAIIDTFQYTPYKLACTATPAPNDYMELGNHAEFVNAMSRTEMLSMFFVHDASDTSKWRLKGHAKDKFWAWMASWAVSVRMPSDLGYDDCGFKLPDLNENIVILENQEEVTESLIAMPAQTLTERREARKQYIDQRIEKVKQLINEKPDDQWLIWCNYNYEADELSKAINCVEVRGSDTPEHKESSLLGFAGGMFQTLVTKPSIAGFGMNWQNCHNVIFLGLSDSYEQYYQALRRCWRYGQNHVVNVYELIGETETTVLENIKKKQKDAEIMAESMVSHNLIGKQADNDFDYKTKVVTGEDWKMYLGDCVEQIANLKDESIHYSIFSPPFASLYTYTNSERDMGNCKDNNEFYQHFRFLASELYRVLRSGRLLSFHCMNLPTSKQRDGFIGIRDFRGELIRIFEDAGFIFHSEVCIWKDPVTAMQRTKALGLLHKQLKKDSAMSRQGIPDYLVTMRKDGMNEEPVTHTNESFPVSVWQNYASPVWMDIRQSNTLQKESARENNDERHICPLQLDVINRALMLWTNDGDTVLSPFAGIGSEGYCALERGRKFIGIELKESYFKCAINNLENAVFSKRQVSFF